LNTLFFVSVLQIASPGFLGVRYRAATQPERSRVTDELYLNSVVGERQWKAGDTISDWQATVRCKPREEKEKKSSTTDYTDIHG
jgi:hypothetical protein